MLFTSLILSFLNKTFQVGLSLLKWLLVPSIILLSMTVKGGTSQACAACKYQRRRCTRDCPLAPFFPADQPKIFQNAHRLFGVANMTKILKDIHDDQKEDAMQSIKYESNMWERFPYNGCCVVLSQLFDKIQAYRQEFAYVRSLIEMVRNDNNYRYRGTGNDNGNGNGLGFVVDPNGLGFNQLNIDPNTSGVPIRNYGQYNINGLQYHNGLIMQSQHQPNRLVMSDFEINNANFGDEGTSYEAEMNPSWAQQQQQSNHLFRIDHRALVSQAKMASQQEIEEPYKSMVSEALVVDDKQSNTEAKEACDSSNGTSPIKGALQSTSVKANELKNAAARFSLTSIKR